MRRPRLTSSVLFFLFLLSALWVALVITSPLMVSEGTLLDLSGSVGVHDNNAQFEGLSPVPKAMYWIGDAECHQIAERSYFLNGNEMPFCARDLGLFLGLAAGFGFVSFYRYKLNPMFALLGFVPVGIDGTVQLLTSYESNNPLRLATGATAGVACALLIALFVFAVQEEKKRPKPVPAEPVAEALP